LRERIFQAEFKADCGLFSCHYEKVPDSFPAAPVACIVCGKVNRPPMRFTPPKPYDSYLVYRGIFYALEFKQHKDSGAFPFDKVSPEQQGRLLNAKANGGRAFIILNVRFERDQKDGPRNQAYAIDIEKWLKQKNEYIRDNNNRKSLPLVEIEANWQEIHRVKIGNTPGLHWDVQSWLKSHPEKVDIF
jgi:penicillin-binding protein-related factor A (putative recombinase)